MTVDWNGAASGWNRASDDWKNYRSPVARKPLAPVGKQMAETRSCVCCGYGICKQLSRKAPEPPVDWLFGTMARIRLTDSLTERLLHYGFKPSDDRFFHQHWALEQLMRGMALSIQRVRGGQVRIGRDGQTRVEVRIAQSQWRQGRDVVDWLMAEAPGELGVFYAPTRASDGPDLEPRKPPPTAAPSFNQMLDQLVAQRAQTEENVARARKLHEEQASLKAAQQAYSRFLEQPGYETLRALGAEQQRQQDLSSKLSSARESRLGGDINFQAYTLQAPVYLK